jgi:hypothetical protein
MFVLRSPSSSFDSNASTLLWTLLGAWALTLIITQTLPPGSAIALLLGLVPGLALTVAAWRRARVVALLWAAVSAASAPITARAVLAQQGAEAVPHVATLAAVVGVGLGALVMRKMRA